MPCLLDTAGWFTTLEELVELSLEGLAQEYKVSFTVRTKSTKPDIEVSVVPAALMCRIVDLVDIALYMEQNNQYFAMEGFARANNLTVKSLVPFPYITAKLVCLRDSGVQSSFPVKIIKLLTCVPIPTSSGMYETGYMYEPAIIGLPAAYNRKVTDKIELPSKFKLPPLSVPSNFKCTEGFLAIDGWEAVLAYLEDKTC